LKGQNSIKIKTFEKVQRIKWVSSRKGPEDKDLQKGPNDQKGLKIRIFEKVQRVKKVLRFGRVRRRPLVGSEGSQDRDLQKGWKGLKIRDPRKGTNGLKIEKGFERVSR
jgi:hypothetical protein